MNPLILFFLLLPYIYAQQVDCSQAGSTCGSCTNNTGCGWCTVTQQCLNGTLDGPASSFCLGQAWIFGQGRCARCEDFSDCRQCMAHLSDCGWCEATGQCRPWSYFKGGVGTCKASSQCPCTSYSTCGDCTVGSNCHWCEKEASCQSIDLDCPIGPGFNKSVNCPCSSNKDCASCKSDFTCSWCNNLGACQNKGAANSTCQISLGTSCDSYCRVYGNSSCLSCSSLNGCGWCTAEETCVDVDHATCMIAHTCDGDCSQHKYCDPCLDNPTCIWCDADNTCKKNLGTATKCSFIAHSCPDSCAAITSCAACNARKGCGWCRAADGSDNGNCLDVDKAGCSTIWVHGCDPTPIRPPTKCGFDGGAFVGGMFLVIGVIVLGAVAYLVYRWKTGRKILYTELR